MLTETIQRCFYYTKFSTPFERAMKLQQSRLLSQPELRTSVEEYFRDTPEFAPLMKEPHLVLFRQVATPLHETLQVLETAKKHGLKVAILEFKSDLFVSTGNEFKRGLGKLPIYDFTDKSGRDKYHYRTVVNFNEFVGKPLSQVKTATGEGLVEFHHDLFKTITKTRVSNVVIDASPWFSQFPAGSKEYYSHFFKLFLCHNILAETFWGQKETQRFIREVVYPAFRSITRDFGHEPLIYNIQPLGEQDRPFWDCYPKEVDEFLKRKGYS